MDRFFEFEKAKLFDTWKRSRNNKYSNPKLQEFHDFFRDFYEKIKNEDIASLTEDKKTFLKDAIDYFQTRVNCLSNNTSTTAPYEVIESIKCAAKEWVSDIDNYIILTRYGDYSFFSDNKEDVVLSYIENDYGIIFNKKTVLLSIPQHYYRDYLNNVVLYHEIGHFVDITQNISLISLQLTVSDIEKKIDINSIYSYFPFLNGLKSDDIIQSGGVTEKGIQLYHYWLEYFADVFAANYIGDKIQKYLSFRSYPDCNSVISHLTHPSNERRFAVINDFINGRDNYITNKIQLILGNKFGKTLNRYNNSLALEDLYKFLPLELKSDNDIHNLYAAAWDVWYGDRSKFKMENNLSYDLQSAQIYSILNNLVEKSISNYLVTKKWNNVPK